jgi:6,7-dimethyl-8-ribityllumazine synthase
MAEIRKTGLSTHNEGIHHLKDALVVLVKTEWNQAIVDELEKGCVSVLKESGVESETIVVPGAVEIPFAIAHYWREAKKKNRPHAFVALGCVIRGGTPHFEYVCQSVTTGITQLNLDLPVPVVFGVLTIDNEKQAAERLGGVHGHKGEEAAHTAIKMIYFTRRFNSKK